MVPYLKQYSAVVQQTLFCYYLGQICNIIGAILAKIMSELCTSKTIDYVYFNIGITIILISLSKWNIESNKIA